MIYETTYGLSHVVAAIMASVYLRNSKIQRRCGEYYLDGGEDLSANGGFNLVSITGFTVPCGEMDFRFTIEGNTAYQIQVYDKQLHEKGPLVQYYFNEHILDRLNKSAAMSRVDARLEAINKGEFVGEGLLLPLNPSLGFEPKEKDTLLTYPIGGTWLPTEFLCELAKIVAKMKKE